jgi:hypothetical protein
MIARLLARLQLAAVGLAAPGRLPNGVPAAIVRGVLPGPQRCSGPGDQVRLAWRSDRPLTLHLHGYDIEWRVRPGRRADRASRPMSGRFPIEILWPDDGHHDTPLAVLEVYPRQVRSRGGSPATAPAAAHGFGQRYDLPVPLSLYLRGAAAAIVFSLS